MRDLVLLFGAGASYGAGGILPERPPLGVGLFLELARLNPHSWGSLPKDIATQLITNFEEGMALIFLRLGGAIPQLMREMAIYFIQFRVSSDACLYRCLLNDLSEAALLSRTCFSTLNYDCVLDFEIARRHELNYFDPPDATRVPLWKLHGSCNMFSNEVQVTQDVSYGTEVTFEGGLEAFLDANRVIERCLVETGLAPVMSLYMRGKPLNVSPSAIASVQKTWAEAVLSARTIAVVGARPWPSDDHVWGPLADSRASLLFVGSERDGTEWAATSRKGETEILGSRLSESYNALVQRIRLHAAD